MNLKYAAVVLCIAVLAALFGVFYYNQVYLSEINFNFYIDEGTQPIEGNVYLNGVLLGFAENGVLPLKKDGIVPGFLYFAGEYQGRNFNFSYGIYGSDLKKHDLNFIVRPDKLNSFTLNFYISETGDPINGGVYLNNKYLGNAERGMLELSVSRLFPGTITLNGTYEEKNFEFYFGFRKEDLGYFQKNFVIPEQRMNDEVFDSSKLNAGKIESAVFDLVNDERKKQEIKQLKWNEKVSGVARGYSESMSVSGFHHKDAEGWDVKDRLKEDNIFYSLAGENLFLAENLNSRMNEYDIAKMAVEGWLKSPGHRSLVLDIDELYSDAGAGAYCMEKYCYVALNFISAEKSINYNIELDNCVFIRIYDPVYPFDFDVKVRLNLNSTKEIRAYIVSNRSEFDSCLRRNTINPVKDYKYVKVIDEILTAKKGYGLLLESKEYSDISIFIDYSP